VRECGTCSLCCKLLGVTELGKAGGKWCEHAVVPGGGCRIYGERPRSCRVFACGWLASEVYPEHWNPRRCKMVIGFDPRRGVVEIYVDQGRRWEQEPWRTDIERLARKCPVEIRTAGKIIEARV